MLSSCRYSFHHIEAIEVIGSARYFFVRIFFFFFQAEDGIRDDLVTGVQTCALPISGGSLAAKSLNDLVAMAAGELRSLPGLSIVHLAGEEDRVRIAAVYASHGMAEIGRASCRERV